MNNTDYILPVKITDIPIIPSGYESTDMIISLAALIFSSLSVIFTGSMVYYIKEQFKIQSIDNHRRTSIESVHEIRTIFDRLEKDKNFTHIINNLADHVEKGTPFPIDDPIVTNNIYFLFNELLSLAILWKDDVIRIDHIEKTFGLIFMNIENTDDVKNYLNVEVKGKKPYEDILLLIDAINN